MGRPPRLFLLAPALVAAAGCAEKGAFPSLAQRPAERAYEAERDAVEAPSPARPDDPAVARRAAELIAEAEAGQAEFERAAGPARAAVARSGAVNSDSWIEGEQAVSRAASAQARTGRALADLDRYAADRTNSTTLSEADAARLRDAVARVQALADAQAAEVARLEASLRRR
jgi:Meckel syndrome type 1 protein